ncbi:MAG: hypothetical protein HY675_17585 [Chloroflexi bacterium]|nr:hypothetical protein [Chloroflexota bacterium]
MAERSPVWGWTVNWSAVLAGFFISVAVAIFLGILMAIAGIMITVAWALIIGIVSVLIGSYFTGLLTPGAGVYNGLLVAVLGIVFGFVLMLLLGGTFTLPLTAGTADSVTFLIGFVVQLLSGAVGGLLGERSTYMMRRT